MKKLEVVDLCKSFKKGKSSVEALNKVCFFMEPGESLGIVGESGSGKSTLAKILTFFETPDSGTIFLDGKNITNSTGKEKKEIYRKIQMIFQNPVNSFNPHIKMKKSILEAAVNFGLPREKWESELTRVMELVGLRLDYKERYPNEISGGECQRAAIARAVLVNPEILICDEITSALDVSIQAQILDLIQELKNKMSMTCLIISHDLAVVQKLCDKVMVLYRGEIVEFGETNKVLFKPEHEYTKLLLASVPSMPGEPV